MKRPASQWYWADWLRDPAIRASSLEARGLWMDMLALMHEGTPYGHLTVGGEAVTDVQLSRMVGETPGRVRRLLKELEAHGVFSRTDSGVITSRRMVRDEHIRNVRADAGRLGGNPQLINGKDIHLDNQKGEQKPTPSSSTASSSAFAPSSNGNGLPSDAEHSPEPPASLLETLPVEARRLLRTFYEFPAMTGKQRERYRNVAMQLVDALDPAHPGPKIRGGQRVKARSKAHLADVCNAVMRDPPNDRDFAVVFVLKKLTDPEKGPSVTELAQRNEQAEHQLEDQYHAAAQRAGIAWAQEHPDKYQPILAEVEARYRGKGGSIVTMARTAELTQKCAKAAGFPTFDQWIESPQQAEAV